YAGSSWFALPRSIAPNVRKFDKRFAVEGEGAEDGVDGEIVNRNVNSHGSAALFGDPFHIHLFRLQTGNDGRRFVGWLRVAKDHHVADGGVAAFDVLRVRCSVGSLRRVT